MNHPSSSAITISGEDIKMTKLKDRDGLKMDSTICKSGLLNERVIASPEEIV